MIRVFTLETILSTFSGEDRVKVSSGYNFLDRVLNGGYDKDGSLVVYVGEQNIGKSIFLANDAANFVSKLLKI